MVAQGQAPRNLSLKDDPIILFTALRWHIVGGAFLAGLAMSNQQTSVLLAAPIVLMLAFVTRGLRLAGGLTTLGYAVTAGLLGLGSYVLLPASHLLFGLQAGSWGEVGSLAGLLHHLRRGDYGSLQLYSGEDAGAEGLVARTRLMLLDWAGEQGAAVLMALAVAGVIVWVA